MAEFPLVRERRKVQLVLRQIGEQLGKDAWPTEMVANIGMASGTTSESALTRLGLGRRATHEKEAHPAKREHNDIIR